MHTTPVARSARAVLRTVLVLGTAEKAAELARNRRAGVSWKSEVAGPLRPMGKWLTDVEIGL
jgi:hypothetical protein